MASMKPFEDFQHIRANSSSYDELFAYFDQDKIIERYKTLLAMCRQFILSKHWLGKVKINRLILANAVMDYFADVKRIKDFHAGTEKINSIKIISWCSSWFLRRKPLQVLVAEPECVFANELFIFFWLAQFIGRESLAEESLTPFWSSLAYYLKYRPINPQTLELMLTAFAAGQTANCGKRN